MAHAVYSFPDLKLEQWPIISTTSQSDQASFLAGTCMREDHTSIGTPSMQKDCPFMQSNGDACVGKDAEGSSPRCKRDVRNLSNQD